MSTREFKLYTYTILKDYINVKYFTRIKDTSRNSITVTTSDDSMFDITISRVSNPKKKE